MQDRYLLKPGTLRIDTGTAIIVKSTLHLLHNVPNSAQIAAPFSSRLRNGHFLKFNNTSEAEMATIKLVQRKLVEKLVVSIPCFKALVLQTLVHRTNTLIGLYFKRKSEVCHKAAGDCSWSHWCRLCLLTQTIGVLSRAMCCFMAIPVP